MSQIRINCDDNGNFHPSKSEGLEHIQALQKIAEQADGALSLEHILRQHEEIMQHAPHAQQ